MTVRDDVIELCDFAAERLLDRLDGVTDEEWAWTPAPDDQIGLRWRLDHIAETLTESRNAEWLGVASSVAPARPADSVEAALRSVRTALSCWQGLLTECSDATLIAPIGAAAGPYAESSRLSFALHIADELIHHGAEVGLLRDLYAAR